jgi:dTDP-4-amino-4,6-dideoxygalactose transaminase
MEGFSRNVWTAYINRMLIATFLSLTSSFLIGFQNQPQKPREINGIIPPYEANDRTHVHHLYAIRVVEQKRGINRDALYKKLSKKGIGLSVHYTPLHLLTFYKKTLGYKTGDFPIAEQVSKEVLSLPIYLTITKTQIDYVVKEISKIMK